MPQLESLNSVLPGNDIVRPETRFASVKFSIEQTLFLQTTNNTKINQFYRVLLVNVTIQHATVHRVAFRDFSDSTVSECCLTKSWLSGQRVQFFSTSKQVLFLSSFSCSAGAIIDFECPCRFFSVAAHSFAQFISLLRKQQIRCANRESCRVQEFADWKPVFRNRSEGSRVALARTLKIGKCKIPNWHANTNQTHMSKLLIKHAEREFRPREPLSSTSE